MNSKLYLSHCQNCKQQTPHFIRKLNLRRGALLMCSKCGSQKTRYSKLNLLIEYKPFTLTKLEENKNEV